MSVLDFDELTTMPDEDFLYFFRELGATKDYRISKENFLKEITTRAIALESGSVDLVTVQDIAARKNFTAGIGLSARGKTFDDHVTTGLAGTGWYTVAEMDISQNNRAVAAEFLIVTTGNGSRREIVKFEISLITDTYIKSHNNCTVKYSYTAVAGITSHIEGVRIAKSDVNASAGVKVQVRFNIFATIDVAVQMQQQCLTTGFVLIDATTTNNTLTPDGSPATYLIAGEERLAGKLSSGATISPVVGCNVVNNDSVRLSILWSEIPFPGGSTIQLVGDSTNNFVISVAGTNSLTIDSTTGSFSNVEIDGDIVHCVFTKVGAFTGLGVFRGGFFSAQSNGLKFTLS